MTRRISLFSALVLTASFAAGDDWPQWRGPQRNDKSAEKGLLSQWPAEGPKQLWLFKDAGVGYSGFSVVKGKLFTMGGRNGKEEVICLDANTGKELWATPLSDIYDNNWGNGPRSTPTVDGERVYALTGKGTLACLEAADGKKVWQTELTNDLGGKLQGWGYTESVIVDENNVICTPGGPKGTMAALDKKTGKVAWQTSDLTLDAQYSSPIVTQLNGQTQYVQLVMKKLFGVAPKDGKVLWQVNFPGSVAVIPTPIASDGKVYVAAGYGVGCLQVKPGTDGTAEEMFKNNEMVNHHGGVILHEGKLYGHSEKGGWTCQDWETGDKVWKSDKLGKGCISFADGKFYCVGESDGTVALIDASPGGWNEHGRFKLAPQTTIRKKDGRIWTHPVIANGRLYLRDQDLVYCYDVKGK